MTRVSVRNACAKRRSDVSAMQDQNDGAAGGGGGVLLVVLAAGVVGGADGGDGAATAVAVLLLLLLLLMVLMVVVLMLLMLLMVVVVVVVVLLLLVVMVVVLLTLSRPQSQHAPPRASQPPRATTPVSPAHAHNTNTATETHTDRHVDTHPTETKRFCSHVFSQCSMLSSSFSSNRRVSFAENTIDQYQIQASVVATANRILAVFVVNMCGLFCCFFYRTSTAAIFSSSVTAAADLPSSPYTIRTFVSFCSVRFATKLHSAQNEITLS